MTDKITYAKAGGPPDNWRNLLVFDGPEQLDAVIECDTVAGYAIYHPKGADGRFIIAGENLCTIRLESKHLRIEVSKRDTSGEAQR